MTSFLKFGTHGGAARIGVVRLLLIPATAPNTYHLAARRRKTPVGSEHPSGECCSMRIVRLFLQGIATAKLSNGAMAIVVSRDQSEIPRIMAMRQSFRLKGEKRWT
jgi:hypothetical protein